MGRPKYLLNDKIIASIKRVFNSNPGEKYSQSIESSIPEDYSIGTKFYMLFTTMDSIVDVGLEILFGETINIDEITDSNISMLNMYLQMFGFKLNFEKVVTDPWGLFDEATNCLLTGDTVTHKYNDIQIEYVEDQTNNRIIPIIPYDGDVASQQAEIKIENFKKIIYIITDEYNECYKISYSFV